MFFGGMPPGFEEAFGGGGMPGGMGGRRPRKEVNTTKLYEVLGVEKNATPDQIKKAYRKLAVKWVSAFAVALLGLLAALPLASI